MNADDQAARDALRERQGGGARYDAESAPHSDLLVARRGTAYFARKLNELADDDLWKPSLREGWSRRHLTAYVSYQARALALSLQSVRTQTSPPAVLSAEERDAEIALGATLPARALRHLFDHSAKHLDVEWRDLADADWGADIFMPDGTRITVCDAPLLRAREIWQGAIDLNNGGRTADIPAELFSRQGQL